VARHAITARKESVKKKQDEVDKALEALTPEQRNGIRYLIDHIWGEAGDIELRGPTHDDGAITVISLEFGRAAVILPNGDFIDGTKPETVVTLPYAQYWQEATSN
jgi:hypothetical protein